MSTTILHQSIANGKQFVSTGTAARTMGTCIQTVKNMIARNELEAYQTRSVNGHWKVSVQSLLNVMGESADDYKELDAEEKSSGVFCYIRVSSESQERAGSMKRQRERVIKAVMEKEGLKESEITVIAECASSLSNRKGLNKLVESMIDGVCKKIYCCWEDRISRLASTTGIVKSIADKFGVEIIALEEETPASENEIMMKELLSIITVYGNRASAAKAKQVCQKTISSDCIARIITLESEGLNIQQITKQIEIEGFKATKKDGTEYRVSHHKVRDILDSNGTHALGKAIVKTEDTFKKWFDSRVRKLESYDKRNMKHRLTTKRLFELYKEDMKQQGKKVVDTKISFGQKCAKILPRTAIYVSSGRRYYLGYQVVE